MGLSQTVVEKVIESKRFFVDKDKIVVDPHCRNLIDGAYVGKLELTLSLTAQTVAGSSDGPICYSVMVGAENVDYFNFDFGDTESERIKAEKFYERCRDSIIKGKYSFGVTCNASFKFDS